MSGSTVYVTVLLAVLPAASTALTVKACVPAVVSIGAEGAHVGTLLWVSLQVNAALIVAPRAKCWPSVGEVIVIVGGVVSGSTV